MKIYQQTNEIVALNFGATIGNFDGVHLGHLAMLKMAKEECVKRGLEFCVITFFPHPLQILKAMRGFLITSYEQRRELLRKAGVDHLVEIPFTRDFSSMDANAFIESYIKNIPNFSLLCLGYDFAFGANKSGDAQTIKNALASSEKEVVSLIEHRPSGQKASSTTIRELIRSGQVGEVTGLLGRPYSLTGKVVRGKGRGKGIGFATANLQIDEEIITPSTGVYATQTKLGGVVYKSVTNVGFNPTFNDNLHMSIETHIIGISHDFYDETMSVDFLGKIREEKRFSSVDELKQQIALDTKKASEWPV